MTVEDSHRSGGVQSRGPHEALDQPPPASGYGPAPGPRTLHWGHRRAAPPQIREGMLEGRLEYLAHDARARLFDLEHDAGERTDLAGAQPADVARMQARHEARFARMTR
jgi:hypothetical protein